MKVKLVGGSRELVQWARVLIAQSDSQGARWSVIDQDTRLHLLASAHAHGYRLPSPQTSGYINRRVEVPLCPPQPTMLLDSSGLIDAPSVEAF